MGCSQTGLNIDYRSFGLYIIHVCKYIGPVEWSVSLDIIVLLSNVLQNCKKGNWERKEDKLILVHQ